MPLVGSLASGDSKLSSKIMVPLCVNVTTLATVPTHATATISFVPLNYNDGSPVEAEKFQDLQKVLLDRFEGVTFFPQQ